MLLKSMNPAAGAGYLVRGLGHLNRRGIRRYVWAPVFTNLVLYTAGFWWLGVYFSSLIDAWIPSWLEWLDWLLWPLFAACLLLILMFSFTLVANLIACPFYGYLVQTTEKNILGLPQPDAGSGGEGALRAVALELKRVGYFLSRAVPILLLFLIPGVNLVAPFVWLAFSAWFLAMEYMSYAFDERGLSFSRQREILKSNRIAVLGFGGMVMLGLAVPLLNLLIPPAAVIGSTLYLYREGVQR